MENEIKPLNLAPLVIPLIMGAVTLISTLAPPIIGAVTSGGFSNNSMPELPKSEPKPKVKEPLDLSVITVYAPYVVLFLGLGFGVKFLFKKDATTVKKK